MNLSKWPSWWPSWYGRDLPGRQVGHVFKNRFGETRKLQMEDDTLGATLRALLHPECKQALKKKATSCIGVLVRIFSA